VNVRAKQFLVPAAVLFLIAWADPVKIKVTADSASLKAAPDLVAPAVAKIPIDTILVAEDKQGSWYKVTLEREVGKITGYIHETLVSVLEEQAAIERPKETPMKEAPIKELPATPAVLQKAEEAPDRSQADILVDIDINLEKSRILIGKEKRYDEALNLLSALIARALKVADQQKRLDATAEIFLLRGLAEAGRGDERSARLEFRNMYEVGEDIAKRLTKNLLDPKIATILRQAEMEYHGLVAEYRIDIASDPPGAKVKADGRDLGTTPATYKTLAAKVLVELEKEGYRSVREEVPLIDPVTKKDYRLEWVVSVLAIQSSPPGARVYLDGNDTGKETNCEIPGVGLGSHAIRLTKDYYAEWQAFVEVKASGILIPVAGRLIGLSYTAVGRWGDLESSVFKKPMAIAVGPDNRVLVIDESPARMKVFSPDGAILFRGDQPGSGLGDIVRPSGVAVDAQGAIYITDSEAHSVTKLDQNGSLVAKWGQFGSGDLEFNSPWGITADTAGDIYVLDAGNSRVKKYSTSGDFLKSWGSAGNGKAEFRLPRAIASDDSGKVYVLDRLQVQKFSPEGEWLAGWGREGVGDGEFNNAQGIAVDKDGCVYVADSGNHRIQKFDGSGRFLCAWAANGQEQGFLNFPVGVAVDSRGMVYVAERDNHRVQMFIVGSSALGIPELSARPLSLRIPG
jgi:DNA-binding beta-propeller fold protein YncE